MKLLTKLLIAGGIIAAPIIYNRLDFINRARFSPPAENEKFYGWRYGKIRYVVYGTGTPLLLIHGIYPGASLDEWSDISSSITRNHCVYKLDLLGFGHSDKPNMSFSAYIYTSLINDFMRDVIGSPTIVVASDYAAAYAVLGYRMGGKLYRKLLMIAPAGISRGHTLPTFKGSLFKFILELPIIGTFAYRSLVARPIKRKAFGALRNKRNIAANIPDSLSPSAFVGGPNARMPIAALISGFLNANIKNSISNVHIPMLILSNACYGLSDILLSKRVVDFVG
ncbi:MAG: alpha/beta fold hydrolase [Clostridiales bacterium]|jgi:pimeloyl-ACP methyl ester carboxylesterase|nr:alpha/beta fold hydrolase [Clostridiales bacterium]